MAPKLRDSFESLYDRWSDATYRYLVHLVGPTPLADDLFQETWMKAVEHSEQLRNQDQFGAWVFRIARNLVYNESRKKKRIGQVWLFSNLENPNDDMPRLLDIQPDHRPGPDSETINSERRHILEKVMANLDQQTQEILQLRYFEQLTLAEVAEVLEIPLGTVCTKTHRGLKAIRKGLESRGIKKLGEI